MRRILCAWSALASLLIAASVGATTFVMPTDEQLVEWSQAVVTGTVTYSFPRKGQFGIETVTQIQVNDALKGRLQRGGVVEIVEPGGVVGKEATYVHASPSFRDGDDVLLFLRRNRGMWETTDLGMGAFYGEQLQSRRVFRRAADVEGVNYDGSQVKEKARSQKEFISYVRAVARGEKPTVNYMIDMGALGNQSLRSASDSLKVVPNVAPFANSTYTSYLSTATAGNPSLPANIGIRWRDVFNAGAGDAVGSQTMPGGVTFLKVSTQNLGGAGDGGVSAIQTGLGVWNNDCGSAVNLLYGGTTATQSGDDLINVVEFNDPQGRIGGTFPGTSSTVGTAFSNLNNIHTINGEFWWVMKGSDVVVQDGVTNASAGLPQTLIHELGHSLGFRHSNATRTIGNGQTQTCNGVDEECTSATNSAVMFWIFTGAGTNGVLQPWDINAVRAVYPGGSCTPVRSDFDADGKSDIILRDGTNGVIAEYQMNGIVLESGAIVGNPGTGYTIRTVGDFNGGGFADLALQHSSTNEIAVWLLNGNTLTNGVLIGNPGAGYRAVASADINNDGRFDIILQHQTTGDVAVWLMSASGNIQGGAVLGTPGPQYVVVGAADFNNDNAADLLMQNTITGDLAQWRITPGLAISAGAVIQGAGPLWTVKGVGDTNADSKADVILRNSNTGDVAIWKFDGFTMIGGILLGNPGGAYDVMGSGNFNGDTSSDILLRDGANGNVAIWLLGGAGPSITGGAVVATPGVNYVPVAK